MDAAVLVRSANLVGSPPRSGAMKLDRLTYSKLLGRPYHPTTRRFEAERRLTLEAAQVIVARVMDMIPARSVVDVGCGVGNWLSVFAQHGVEKIVGLDGSYINRDRLAIDASCFVTCDLNQPLGPLTLGRFDLALSLEVGEHLLPARADRKSTRLNSSHPSISYAVFCLKKKKSYAHAA